jgi:hypothetical protein
LALAHGESTIHEVYRNFLQLVDIPVKPQEEKDATQGTRAADKTDSTNAPGKEGA